MLACACMFRASVVMLFAVCSLSLQAQYLAANPDWNRPIEPFRVAGNLYYVGASDVSAYLITTSKGHILLDTGFRETVPLIEANLAKLGFHMTDVRLILTSHAHYDHAGGVADVKQRTKARFLANPAEAPLFRRGGKGDFAFGDKYPYPPVSPDGALSDGVPVKLGETALTPHFTPGHTKGCTSWAMKIQDGGRGYNVVIACSLSAPGYKLVGNEQYPQIVQDFEASIAKLRALPCDIFVGFHSWDFALHQKRKAPSADAFVDPAGYKQFLDKAEAALATQVKTQSSQSTIPTS